MASGEQVARWAYDAGFRGQNLINIVAIAKRESGWNPQAWNGNRDTGDQSVGLTQINMIDSLGVERAKQLQRLGYGDGTVEGAINALKDGATNMKFAYHMSGGTDLSAWGAYKGESNTYGTNLDEARRIVESAGLLDGGGAPLPNAAAVDDGPHSAPQPGSEGTGNFKPDQDPRQLTADAIQKKANLQAQLANYLASHPELYQSNGRWGTDKSEPVISERTGKVIDQGDPVFTVDDFATGLMRQISALDSTIATIGELSKARYFTTGGAAGEEYITVNPDPAAILDAKQKKQWEDYVGRVTDIEDLVQKERSFDIQGDRANAQTAEDMQNGLIGPGWGTYYSPRPGRADFNPQAASRFSSDSADLLGLQGYGEVGQGQLVPEEVNEYDMLMGRTRVPAFAFGTAPRPGTEGIDPRLLALVGKPSVPMPKPQIRGIPDNGLARAPAPGGF